jgi:hypothetical protein
MRKVMLLAVVLVGCSKSETPATDTTAAAAAPAAAPAPAKLTAADVSGNWNGVTKAEASDSVLGRWTSVHVTDSTGKVVFQGAKDSIPYKATYDGDSMIAVSSPYISPATPKGAKVTFRSVGRLKDGKLSGTVLTMLAAKPDSVVARSRWEATKAP